MGRIIVNETNEEGMERRMYKGVPQCSVLGPLIWNCAYDGLLRKPVRKGCSLIGYADAYDVALFITDRTLAGMEAKLTAEIGEIDAWMRTAGLSIAAERTEVVFLNCKVLPIGYRIPLLTEELAPAAYCRYLGIMFDPTMKFRRHIATVTTKAVKIMAALSRVIPNSSHVSPAQGRTLPSFGVHSTVRCPGVGRGSRLRRE